MVLWKPQQKTRSVRRRLLVPVAVLLAAEMLLLCVTVFASGLFQRLDQNAVSALQKDVASRANYLQTEMNSRWSNLSHTAESLQQLHASLLESGSITSAGLTTDSQQYSTFLTAAAPELIALMRTASVTGAYVVLNTNLYTAQPLTQAEGLPCLYIRDRDPVSSYADGNGDLLLEHAPVETVKALGISSDSFWTPMLQCAAGEAWPDAISMPCRALLANSALTATQCGYWSPGIFSTDSQAISYSIPLTDAQGRIYGTLGVDILQSYLRTLLPISELSENAYGTYLLYADVPGANDSFVRVYAAQSGVAVPQKQLEEAAYQLDQRHSFLARLNGEALFFHAQQLNLYGADSPFHETIWYLSGGLPERTLFALSDLTALTLFVSVALLALICLIGVVLITRLVTRPVESLSDEVRVSTRTQPLSLHMTGIQEIDTLAHSIEDMSRELYRTAGKFSQIISMASKNIGGFEVNHTDGTLFVNDAFFCVFGLENAACSAMTLEQFHARFSTLNSYVVSQHKEENSDVTEYLYSLPQQGSGRLWVRLRLLTRGEARIGLAEDVTTERQEMEKIAFERDHDVLTGLLNRRAWGRSVNALFAAPQKLKTAALLMIDLDNLKYVNDNYGHDAGDAYICAAADAVRAHTPVDAVSCRKSGDEFLVFLYGYDTREELHAHLLQLHTQFRGISISLKNGENYPLRASGGVAWYPEDTADLGNLIRYADFAMYKVKHNTKGEFSDFDMGTYKSESYLLQGTRALDEMIEQSLVDYHFQPIVEVATAEVFAYEALMRPRVECLRNPADVLALARQEGKLDGIERLTWFGAMDAFVQHCRQGFVNDTCRVFINSFPDRILGNKDLRAFAERFRPYLWRIVQEQVECEQVDPRCQRRKRALMALTGAATALDDYGSGYSGEKMLLEWKPDFVKLDLDLVRGVDSDADRRDIIASTVAFAHTHHMRVIAEGVETEAEMATLVRLHVDLLQGYYLARPALIPPVIPQETRQQILACAATADGRL